MANQIAPLPVAPQRSDAPSTFISKADAHVAALAAWTTEVNAVSTEIEVHAAEALSSEAAAAASESTASSASTVSQSNANYKGEWSGLTGAANVPYSVSHAGQFWQLLSNVADITLSEPGVTGDWHLIAPYKTASYLNTGAIALNSIWMADSSVATVTRQTPANPTDGVEFTVVDDGEAASGTKKIVIQYDGVNKIMGLTENMEITTVRQFATFKFRDSSNDWRLV